MKIIIISLLFSGCAIGPYLANGFYADQKGPITISNSKSSYSKTGKSCATNILGVYSHGDNSIETARINGGIKNISHADYHVKSVFGIYTDVCTIVKGD